MPAQNFHDTLLDLMEAGASNHQIALALNKQGFLAAREQPWSAERVKGFRKRSKRRCIQGHNADEDHQSDADADPDDSLFQTRERPTQVSDFYPYELPVGADFCCIPLGQPGISGRGAGSQKAAKAIT